MGFPKRPHDPNAVLDYPSDWTSWLPAGDTIVAATATVVGPNAADLTVEDVTFTTTKVVAWVSGGVVGRNYTLTFHITTNDGRADDRSMTLVCKER